METHRNKFVIRQESGHPGYRSTTILATREDLAALADELKQKIDANYQGVPFVHHYATVAHGQSSRVYLQFEPKTEREIEALHLLPAGKKAKKLQWIVWGVVALAFFGCALLGAFQIVHWLVHAR